ncbi:MAG TPA: hypothetical protein PKC45_04390 [Gemmatales bacterium]|nr:hypothetical protein [Gemmatales bacterium]
MKHSHDIPHCDDLGIFDWDESEVRDLIRTTPLRYDEDGNPVGYEADQLFGLEEVNLGRYL